LKIQETHYGPDHVHAGTTLGNMALVYARLGKFAEADKLADKTIEIFKRHVKVQGRTYLEGALHSRAEILFAMGKVREGMQAEEESLSLYQYELGKVFAFSSEANMHAFVERKNGYVPTLVNMALQARDDATTTQVFDWTLRLKGMIFDTLCRYRQAQNLLSKDEDLRESVARFRSHKEFLANMALNPPAGKDAARVQKEIDKVQGEAAELEKELTRAIAQKIPDVVAGRENITSEQVRKRLPADGALIEFVRVSMRDFKKEGWGDIHYVAFVLTPDMKAPKLVDLGPAKEIDALIEVVRKEFTDFQEKLKDCESAEEVRDLEKAQEKQFAARCAPLYKLLFAPVRKELGKASLLYLAPDGAINRLPFEALVDADGKYLVENYRCAYVSSGRDLLRTVHEPAKGTVVFANPDFKLDAEERLARVEKLLPKKEINLALRGQSSAELRSAGWKNLPGAAAEAKDIQKLLGEGKYGPVKSHVGPDALEELLKAMPAPRVLHLATHGFFLDRATDDKPPADEGAGAGWARGRLKRMDNPLLRSGIVLAGANTIGDKDVAARVEDGWVTAEEIALLNLNGTELVVLSACQTGLGDIKSGEGVQGLRRAFLHAGAQTLVTSLFEVPDAETRHLMNRFYANYNGGAGKLRALHAAQRGFIDDRRKTQGAAHPFFWASFVLVGSPD
jgi:CHAT domain-containing protein